MLRNTAIDAVRARDAVSSPVAVAALAAEYAGDPLLPALPRLLERLRLPIAAPLDRAAAARILQLTWMAPARAAALAPRLEDPALDRLMRQFDTQFEGDGDADHFAGSRHGLSSRSPDGQTECALPNPAPERRRSKAPGKYSTFSSWSAKGAAQALLTRAFSDGVIII